MATIFSFLAATCLIISVVIMQRNCALAITGNLQVHAKRASNLEDHDRCWLWSCSGERSDPYMKIIAERTDGSTVERRSRIISNNLNPRWDQWIQFGYGDWLSLEVSVFDADKLSADDGLCAPNKYQLYSTGDSTFQETVQCYTWGHAYIGYKLN